jgi:hypothetical protein
MNVNQAQIRKSRTTTSDRLSLTKISSLHKSSKAEPVQATSDCMAQVCKLANNPAPRLS